MAQQKREWKPGDVLMVRGEVALVTTCTPEIDDLYVETARGRCLDMGRVDDARPLVVIDPEDREQIKRLVDLYEGGVTLEGDMQAALREFANPTPPKPEEPKGLGAVVEDADGVRWVRVNCQPFTPFREVTDNSGGYCQYRLFDNIAAVKVLSEGVVPS